MLNICILSGPRILDEYSHKNDPSTSTSSPASSFNDPSSTLVAASMKACLDPLNSSRCSYSVTTATPSVLDRTVETVEALSAALSMVRDGPTVIWFAYPTDPMRPSTYPDGAVLIWWCAVAVWCSWTLCARCCW